MTVRQALEWTILPFMRLFDFEGRSCRREFWMFTLAFSVLMLAVILLAPLDHGLMVTLGAILTVVALLPALAVQVRRFHDINASGWMVLWNLLPYVGIVIVLVAMCRDGTIGPNRFGADPQARTDDLYELFH